MTGEYFSTALAVIMLLVMLTVYDALIEIRDEMKQWQRSPVCEWSMKFIEKQEGKDK